MKLSIKDSTEKEIENIQMKFANKIMDEIYGLNGMKNKEDERIRKLKEKALSKEK